MKIDFLCSDGSPIGVTLEDLYGDKNRIGVGGSEYAMLTMCEEWHKQGHQVTIYNNPSNVEGSPWEHRTMDSFEPNANRDVLIVFRSPNPKAIPAKGLKVWWSCDQYTTAAADFKKFPAFVNKTVVISPRHRDYFEQTYSITGSVVIDIPVRLADLNIDVDRVSKKCIFTSVPDRGLNTLYECWKVIHNAVPDSSLTITSDYRLWGAGELNEPHRIRWFMESGVTFLGAVRRERLIKEQLSSELLTYPSNYDELFCVAVAEAQACGVYPITSDTGSLPTTNMGTVLPLNDNFKAQFTKSVIDALDNKELHLMREEVRQKAIKRFSPENVAKEWDEKVFNG